MRKSSGVKDSANAFIDATSKATENGGRLNYKIGTVIRIGVCFRESIDDGGNDSELDVREFLGTVTDNLILNFSDSFELDFVFGGRETVEDLIRGRTRSRHGDGGGSSCTVEEPPHSAVTKPRSNLFFIFYYFCRKL